MGGGPSNVPSSTTTSLPAWIQPIAQQYLQTGLGLVSPGNPLSAPGGLGTGTPGAANLGQYNPAMNVNVAPFTPAQMGGMNYLTGAAAPVSANLAGTNAGMLGATESGAYLGPGANPWLDQTYGAASRGLVNQYLMATAPSAMVGAQQGGVGGGSADRQNQAFNRFNLGTNLSDLATNIYGQNYQLERTRQLQAANLVPGAQGALVQPGAIDLSVGAQQQGQQQAQLDAATRNAIAKQQYPYQLLSFLASLSGQAGGGTGTTSATGPNPNSSKGFGF